jgi:hypothetical protein
MASSAPTKRFYQLTHVLVELRMTMLGLPDGEDDLLLEVGRWQHQAIK